MYETLKNWDRDLFIWLNGLGIEDYDAFWIYVTQIESWIPLFVFFFFLLFYFYGWKKGLVVLSFLLITVTITLLFTDFVKEYKQRLRPNNVEALATIIRILQKPENYSFFSGHASSSFSIVTFLVLSLKNKTNWIYTAYLWPLLFVTSRIYVGVHYPSDIFVGALVGTSIAFIVHYVSNKVVYKLTI